MTHQKLDEKELLSARLGAFIKDYIEEHGIKPSTLSCVRWMHADRNEEFEKLQSELAELKSENETLKRAVIIAERRDGDTSELMDASQEAQHYDWLDNKNAKLKEELSSAREVIEVYANKFNWRTPSGKVGITLLTNGEDSELLDGHWTNGKRARDYMTKFGVGK